MKTIIKVWLFMLAVGLLSQCEKEPLAKVTIPDDNFLNALIERGVDSNGDGIITTLEAYKITQLLVPGESISDLTGIEAFVNLDGLDCSNNQLTTLDVSNNTALKLLICRFNQLTTLDVNTDLGQLICSNNQLTTLDVSNNTYLTLLDCSNNQLTTLDVSNLHWLNCSNNLLTSLDVSNNTDLWELDCESNQLTTLDLSNTDLRDFICSNNQLTTLDVSNNTALLSLRIGGMPSLNQVCVWTLPFPPGGVDVYTDGSPNVYFTTDCSK
ncbi:hypothetical protein ES705_17044 [subsurface metagenome]